MTRVPLPEITPDRVSWVAPAPPPTLMLPPDAPMAMALSMVNPVELLVRVPPFNVRVPEDR